MRYGNDAGSIIGGLLSGFSGTYFPMREANERRDLQRERMELDRQQNEALMGMRRQEAQGIAAERAAKLQEMAQEQAWADNFMGSGGQTPQVTPQVGADWLTQAVPGGRVSSEFGPRTPPMPGASSNHQGIDVAAPAWTPIRAPMGGNFSYGQDPKLGNNVTVDDGQGGQMRFGHLMDFGDVNRSQVNPGDVLGYVGQSGLATGPHAHIATSRGGQPVNPREFATGPVGAQYAQAGPRVMSDASGGTTSPVQRFISLPADQAAMEIARAPKGRRDMLEGMWKMANEKKDAPSFQVIKGGDGRQYRFDPKTGQAAPIEGIPGENGGGKPDEEKSRHLRDKFITESKPFVDSKSAYNRILSAGASNTAAGDMSLIFSYMKMLDPGSTVREGEYASAEDTRSFPDSVRAMFNKTVSGEKLTVKQRKEFLQQAKKVYGRDRSTHDQRVKEYERWADTFGMPRGSVIQDLTADIDQYEQSQPIQDIFNSPDVPMDAVSAHDGTPKNLNELTTEQLLQMRRGGR